MSPAAHCACGAPLSRYRRARGLGQCLACAQDIVRYAPKSALAKSRRPVPSDLSPDAIDRIIARAEAARRARRWGF